MLPTTVADGRRWTQKVEPTGRPQEPIPHSVVTRTQYHFVPSVVVVVVVLVVVVVDVVVVVVLVEVVVVLVVVVVVRSVH